MAVKRKPNRRLIELRLNAGLSQRELAALTGLTAPTVSLAERGHTPHPSTQLALADFFALDATALFTLESQKGHSWSR